MATDDEIGNLTASNLESEDLELAKDPSDPHDYLSSDEINNEDGLIVTDKGNLKWNGSYMGLKNFIMMQQISAEHWTSSGGDCKKCEDSGLIIRWYSSKGSLTFGGEKSKEVKNKLLLLAQNKEEVRTKSSCDKQQDNLHTVQTKPNGPLGAVFTQAAIQQRDHPQNEFIIKVEKFIETTNLKISNLVSEVSELKMNKSNSTLTNNDASVANNDLNEIKLLREKNINITHSVADLNSKIEELESEKQSLKTALKILYADLETAEGNMQSLTDKHEAQQHPWITVSGKSKGHPINLELNNNNNKYSALHVEDDTEIVIDSDETKASVNSAGSRNKYFPHHTPKTKTTRRPIAILGDSMIKGINSRKLQHGLKQKVIVKTFPGAHVEDMTHYVKPTLASNPAEVIVHIGTNDLKYKSPSTLLKTVDNLGEMITESKDVKLTLSEIITRCDDETLADKVNIYNELLANLCTERNWGLIKNSNIKKDHLNNYGLHLNPRGSTVLAKNFKLYVSNQN
ncbi:Furin [Paramuricea clavata]|uniref:Furin, partial n=1 Tax=Paramuricea clavata TaxID=317549 RepID=A0A6S7FKY8_PARCT|nr:Furin [Paramuricea clavata]